MSKTPVIPRCDIDADLSHIEQSLVKIESPQMRYLIAQIVDLITEGVVALDGRAAGASEFVAKQRKKPRTRRGKTLKPPISNFRPEISVPPSAP